MSEQEYNPDIYTLVDEENVEHTFELLDIMELEGERYFALIPYYEEAEETLEDDGDLIILKSEMVDGEEMMASIDDDEEYERIGQIFMEQIEQKFEDVFYEEDDVEIIE